MPIFWQSIKPVWWLEREADRKGRDLYNDWRRRGNERHRSNYLVSSGFLCMINETIWLDVYIHLKSSAHPWVSKWAVLYFTPRNLGDFKPRFKCHNSKHISKASAHTKGQSYSYQREHFLAHIQRYKEALVWETFVCLREGCIGVTEDSIRVQPRLWLVFQWSILNQQNQLHGRA